MPLVLMWLVDSTVPVTQDSLGMVPSVRVSNLYGAECCVCVWLCLVLLHTVAARLRGLTPAHSKYYAIVTLPCTGQSHAHLHAN